MEALINLSSQIQFSLTASQVIISLGILAAAYLTGRLKIGIFASLASIGYWIYNANETVLIQMAAANAYALFTTMFVGLFMGFFLIYAWVSPSSR